MEKIFSRQRLFTSPIESVLLGLGILGIVVSVAFASIDATKGFALGVLYAFLTARNTRSILANISEGRSRNVGIIPISVCKVIVIGLLLYLITGEQPVAPITAFLIGIGLSLPAAFIVYRFQIKRSGN